MLHPSSLSVLYRPFHSCADDAVKKEIEKLQTMSIKDIKVRRLAQHYNLSLPCSRCVRVSVMLAALVSFVSFTCGALAFLFGSLELMDVPRKMLGVFFIKQSEPVCG